MEPHLEPVTLFSVDAPGHLEFALQERFDAPVVVHFRAVESNTNWHLSSWTSLRSMEGSRFR